jgi:hypothetical protein
LTSTDFLRNGILLLHCRYFNGGTAPWLRHDNEGGRINIAAQHSSLERRRMNVPQHDDTWYRRGQAAYAGLNRTDPDAIWMYQGFAFVGWDTDEQASFLKGFVDSVPQNRFVVIDMGYSPDGEWQKWNNASFFGTPFIWTKLYNFGDTMGLRGDLHRINNTFPFQAQKVMSSIVGIGATPEGIDINPLYFDFFVRTKLSFSACRRSHKSHHTS